MVEEGHAIVIKQDGRKVTVGFVPGKHYLRLALEETERELPDLLKEFIHRVGRELGFDVT